MVSGAGTERSVVTAERSLLEFLGLSMLDDCRSEQTTPLTLYISRLNIDVSNKVLSLTNQTVYPNAPLNLQSPPAN